MFREEAASSKALTLYSMSKGGKTSGGVDGEGVTAFCCSVTEVRGQGSEVKHGGQSLLWRRIFLFSEGLGSFETFSFPLSI